MAELTPSCKYGWGGLGCRGAGDPGRPEQHHGAVIAAPADGDNDLTLHTLRGALALLCATLAFSAHAAGPAGNAADYGAPAAPSAATRSITVDSTTRHINVMRGETVTIIRDGQRFSWQVDTYSNRTRFALAEIAPEGMMVDGVIVYVAANPLYAGN